MKAVRAFLSLVIALGGLALLAPLASAQVYPSAGAFWVIGAGWYDPTDPQTIQDGLVTAADVIRWEATHADFAAWTGFKYRTYVPTMVTLDYLYVGALSESGTPISASWEPALRQIAINKGHNYEDFLLHYQEDTWQNLTTLYQDAVAWAGVPVGVGYTLSDGDQHGVVLPGTGPWSADIFQGVSQGGAFYLADPEKFAEATLTFAPGGSNGAITIEYASAVDSQFNVTQWKPLSLTSDGTLNFSRNGTIKWTPPADWVWSYNPVPQGVSQNYAFWLRVTGRGYGQRPILTGLKTRAWVGVDTAGAHQGYVKISGWDPANDRNGDGYVDDQEYLHLVNSNATARFRYESRVAINWIAFAPTWSYCYTNTANPQFQQDLAQYYQTFWATTGYNGGYNDNFFVNLLSYFNPILAGGGLAAEGPIQGRVQDSSANLAYSTAFDAALRGVRQATGTHWMGTNTYFINPYDYHPFNVPFPDLGKAMQNSAAFDWFILEGTPFDCWSMVDAEAFGGQISGLSRIWHIAAFAKSGVKSAIMGRVGPHLLTPPSTQAIWERSQMGLLAQYYLYHFPGLTAFQLIYYNNTDMTQLTTTDTYYKPGVPADYAYQPHRALAVDIGTPTGVVPPGHLPMQYTAAVDGTGQRNNTIIGVSTDTVLNHPVYGSVPVSPTADYYLLARPTAPYTRIVTDPDHRPFPAEVVLARNFTKGMVVFRTPFSRPLNDDYADYSSDANQITVTLPGVYQKVSFDGSLAPPSNQVTLHGFEGAVLVGSTVPVITSLLSVNGPVGSPFQYQITATDDPTHFGTTPLPIGLQLNGITGLISGTPRNVGLFRVGLSATNPYATGTDTLWINVTP